MCLVALEQSQPIICMGFCAHVQVGALSHGFPDVSVPPGALEAFLLTLSPGVIIVPWCVCPVVGYPGISRGWDLIWQMVSWVSRGTGRTR
jgi:hypothetical protein